MPPGAHKSTRESAGPELGGSALAFFFCPSNNTSSTLLWGQGMPAGMCLPSSRGVQPHDILYRLSLDILYPPARAKCAPELADGMEDSGYSRTAGSVCSGGYPGRKTVLP